MAASATLVWLPSPEGLSASAPAAAPCATTSGDASRRRLIVGRAGGRRVLLSSLSVSSVLLLTTGSPLFSVAAAEYNPVSPNEKDASLALSRRVSTAIELLEKGKELQAQGDFAQALRCFTQVIEDYKDFAFSEYARVGRALALYEVGDREEAIAEMEDVSISLKGYPEVHAALAAALYVDKHAPLLAENQFTIATLLDPHYTDISYVKYTKHWPPSLLPTEEETKNCSRHGLGDIVICLGNGRIPCCKP